MPSPEAGLALSLSLSFSLERIGAHDAGRLETILGPVSRPRRGENMHIGGDFNNDL